MRLIAALMLLGLMAGCSDDTAAPEATTPATSGTESMEEKAPISAVAMDQWSRNCTLCHLRGEGGAPVHRDKEAWAPRVAQGEDALLQNTVEGLNNMPPLGYCMDCEEEDFREINRFMAGIEP